MEKSILIIGQKGTGKTTLLNQLKEKHQCQFVFDGAIEVEDILSLESEAIKNDSKCIVTMQRYGFNPEHSINERFEIINLNR